ncbi:hypothetical protein KFE96_00610 [Kordiimonas sp. SCSIO 12603]|uniref:hypothetical protein n=1 Tax=Kordiimonas sp. SCSIO 12603 TaxID=2829596 RepID=UPI00210559D2|nr:hypothetical protein [Kordiimonas sp. SCSIO 12603]UTW58844.1 hypothetical protein KFE96_00610 [Kordiimonas sp. SCSIO 12603]
MFIREITRRRFDALCYAKMPTLRYIACEVAWYEAIDGKLLCTITKDLTDGDYGFVILGRDSRRLFRAISLCKNFYPSPADTYPHLLEALEQFAEDGKDIYPQGDEVIPPNEIFDRVVDEDKIHPYFKILRDEPHQEAARNIIKEIAYSFIDVDGHYIKEFQGRNFDARLWELFLHTYFYHAGFERQTEYDVPDYLLNKLGYQVAVEAVTVGANEAFDQDFPLDGVATIELNQNYAPIKFGSALWSKVTRKNPYWEMEQVKGKPFILAVHDYHRPAGNGNLGSMTYTKAGLGAYLYGQRDVVVVKDGKIAGPKIIEGPNGPEPEIEQIIEHCFEGKTIPSNFFSLPEAKHVSAVIFSNGATLTTFNRMGKLAGLGSQDIKMIRKGMCASEHGPIPFSVDVDDPNYEEAWGDTIVMYHNPNASIPVNPETFPDIAHVHINPEDGHPYEFAPAGHISTSVTFTIRPVDGDTYDEAMEQGQSIE